ncbi:MAG TPA: YqcC family protein [Thiolapillus brandeum]|uniref:YqcC family protein n=1 Tax=Thiolapillus brandeum TaxID=1076588 RepID=A0A831JQA0_9GAMM|nr:YqcC family protein [Thiolapillus brandeum]
MNNDYQELSQYLQRLEYELRLLGWWSKTTPDTDTLQSTAPFCHDRMTFDQWLQWIFIPRLEDIINNNGPLPETCAIAPMAEISWREESPEAISPVVRLLFKLDAYICEYP